MWLSSCAAFAARLTPCSPVRVSRLLHVFPCFSFRGTPDVEHADMKAMTLGLSHSLGRYKLKFSPDKVDTMIVQAICKCMS